VRIAQIMAGAPQGGAELFFERLSIALHQAGEEVLPVIRPDPARMARLQAAGLRPRGLRFGGPLDPLTRVKADRLLSEFDAEIAVAWMSRATSQSPRGTWPLVGRLGGYYDLKYFRRCDHLVGNTRDIVRWIAEQGWPAARVSYVPNFVDDFTDVAPADRAALGVPADAPLVLGLGRLHEVKGFDVLIRAIAALQGVHGVIAGEGPERQRLAALVRDCGVGDRVHLPGWRTDVGALLKAADVFVSSSRHEPLGNMVLEAFSAGVPVVAAAAEGPRELITPGGDGLLVDIDDPAALASCIGSVLGDRVRGAALAVAGRARFSAEFSAPVVVAAWRELLGELVRKGRR